MAASDEDIAGMAAPVAPPEAIAVGALQDRPTAEQDTSKAQRNSTVTTQRGQRAGSRPHNTKSSRKSQYPRKNQLPQAASGAAAMAFCTASSANQMNASPSTTVMMVRHGRLVPWKPIPRRHSHSWMAQASQSVSPATRAARHEHISQKSSAITRNHARLQTGQSCAAAGSGRSAGGSTDRAPDAARSAAWFIRA